MLDILIDNTRVMFDRRVFQYPVDILMGTNCAPLLSDLFIYSYVADFAQTLLNKKKKKLARLLV